MASSKARGEREPEVYPQGYIEDSVEPRTQLKGSFNARLAEEGHHRQTHQ
jgi:predicted HicB family RNase H-like nuclease